MSARRRSPRDVDRLLRDLRRLLREYPNAGVLAGVIDLDEDSGRIPIVAVPAVDFTQLHCVALADAALEHAGKRLAAWLDPPLDLIRKIETARAALDFVEERAHA